MDNHSEPDLEAFIHEELRRLPELHAPVTLVPRVLELIQAQALRPWWRRSWWSWPRPMQAGSFIAFVISAALLTLLGWALWQYGVSLSPQLDQQLAPMRTLWDVLGPLCNAFAVVLRAVAMHPWMLAACLFSAAMYLMLVGVGSCFVRLADKRCV
jgi:hypothetical protein